MSAALAPAAFTVVRVDGGYTVVCRCGERLGGDPHPTPQRADDAAWLEALWHPAHGCERCQRQHAQSQRRARVSRRRGQRLGLLGRRRPA